MANSMPSNNIEANLRHDNGLLHVFVSENVVPHWVRERSRDVGANVLGPEATTATEKNNSVKLPGAAFTRDPIQC